MNFLAHFHLAWPDEGLVAGGLEGDYCKGVLRGQLPESLERGVKLHRAIDAYTDAHPLIVQLRRELPHHLRRYAGILIDLSFDHYLSVHWSRFSELPLAAFNCQVMQILRAHESSMSDGARTMVTRFEEHDILNLYQQWDTVPAAAARIGQRFTRHNPFLQLESDLTPARPALERTFLDFYPQLEFFCSNAIEQL